MTTFPLVFFWFAPFSPRQEEDESQDLYAGKTATAAALDDFVVQKAVDPPRGGAEWRCNMDSCDILWLGEFGGFDMTWQTQMSWDMWFGSHQSGIWGKYIVYSFFFPLTSSQYSYKMWAVLRKKVTILRLYWWLQLYNWIWAEIIFTDDPSQ